MNGTIELHRKEKERYNFQRLSSELLRMGRQKEHCVSNKGLRETRIALGKRCLGSTWDRLGPPMASNFLFSNSSR